MNVPSEAIPHDFNMCRCEQIGRCLVHCRTCSCRRDAHLRAEGAAAERDRVAEQIANLKKALRRFEHTQDLAQSKAVEIAVAAERDRIRQGSRLGSGIGTAGIAGASWYLVPAELLGESP